MTADTRATGEIGARQRQRQETSAVIEQAALKLFAKSGFDAVTADEIADAAKVARRTVFRYFPGGKEEIVLRDLRGRMEDLRSHLESRPPQEPALAALRASLMELVVSYEDDYEESFMRGRILDGAPSLAARAMGEQIRLTDSLIHLIALRLAADPATDMRPGIIVNTSLAAMNVAFQSWLTPGNTRPLKDVVAEALDLINDGLEEIGVRSVPAASARPQRGRARSSQ